MSLCDTVSMSLCGNHSTSKINTGCEAQQIIIWPFTSAHFGQVANEIQTEGICRSPFVLQGLKIHITKSLHIISLHFVWTLVSTHKRTLDSGNINNELPFILWIELEGRAEPCSLATVKAAVCSTVQTGPQWMLLLVLLMSWSVLVPLTRQSQIPTPNPTLYCSYSNTGEKNHFCSNSKIAVKTPETINNIFHCSDPHAILNPPTFLSTVGEQPHYILMTVINF